MAAPPNLAWYRSFYWRIGITFVAFVVVFLITQGLILSRIPRDNAEDYAGGLPAEQDPPFRYLGGVNCEPR